MVRKNCMKMLFSKTDPFIISPEKVQGVWSPNVLVRVSFLDICHKFIYVICGVKLAELPHFVRN